MVIQQWASLGVELAIYESEGLIKVKAGRPSKLSLIDEQTLGSK